MTEIHVARTIREGRDMAPRPTNRPPKTTLASKQRNSTFRAPVSRPGDDSHNGTWGATSRCGRWAYRKIEGGQWLALFIPTGQYREQYGSLDAAREATFGERGLLLELRREAYTAALVERTEQGQRWLAIHMRMAAAVSAEYRCQCGGLIAQVTEAGGFGHVDACDECLPYGGQVDAGTRCEHAGEHKFCAAPAPAECAHHGDDRRYGRCDLPALPNRGEGCERGGAEDCCGGCCASE